MRQAVIVAVPYKGLWWTVHHPDRGVCLPGGKVDPGESPENAAYRELWEETGVLVDPAHMRPFAKGVVRGEVDFQVTAFLVPPTRAWVVQSFGEAGLRPALRSLSMLRAAPWAQKHDFHRAVYNRLAWETT